MKTIVVDECVQKEIDDVSVIKCKSGMSLKKDRDVVECH